MRKLLADNAELAARLHELEERVDKHDGDLVLVMEALRKLLNKPNQKSRKIGF